MTTRILPDGNFNTSPPQERRPTRLRPILTLKPGELVRISLRGRASDRLNAWAGRVTAVDGVALRITATHSRFDWSWSRATGEIVLPWSTVENIGVQVDGQ